MVIGYFYDKMWLVRCTDQTYQMYLVLTTVLVLVFLPIIEKKS